MARSQWKNVFIDRYLIRKPSIYKIWSRRSTIPFFLVNKFVSIYNGKSFKRIFITSDKIGYKFGTFSFTRKLRKKEAKILKRTKPKK